MTVQAFGASRPLDRIRLTAINPSGAFRKRRDAPGLPWPFFSLMSNRPARKVSPPRIDEKWLFFQNQNISASQARFFSSARPLRREKDDAEFTAFVIPVKRRWCLRRFGF